MDSTAFKTFTEWPQAGRSVCAGQRAKFYLVAPDGSSRVAVFSEDQTEPLDSRDTTDWVLTPVEELDPPGKRKPGTKGFVKVGDAKGGGTTIWCGSDKALIKLLKSRGYRYSMKYHRWYKPDADPADVADKLEAAKYTVERLFDESCPVI